MLALVKNPSTSATEAQEILKSEPDYVPALMVVAVVDEQKNDAAAAIQTYKKVLADYPYFAPALKRLAILIAENTENDPQANDYATKARAAYPEDPAVAKAMGIIVYRQADYSRAERLLNESLDAISTDPELYYYLGMAQYHLKKTLECKKNLQKAIGLNLSSQFSQDAKKVLAELK
jgi:predicted Zn-dependent protease